MKSPRGSLPRARGRIDRRGLVALALSCILPLATVPAWAECPTDLAERDLALAKEKRPGLLCLDGVLGYWMPMPQAKKILEKAQTESDVRQENTLLKKRLDIEKKRVLLLELDQKDLEKIAGHWRDAALAGAKALADHENRLSRSTWFSLGAIAGMVTSVILAVSIHYITD